jgi:quinoprotein glucose dehydrogenase
MRFLRATLILAAALSAAYAQNDWRSYGGTDPDGSVENRRYSSLKQIDASNVTRLTEAWTYNSRPAGTTGAARASQVTPLVVNGVLYLLTYYQSLVAMEPETGKQLWVYAHQHPGRPPRGIAYWPGGAGSPAEILFGTYDGFLVAVDAKTGKPVAGFGNNGEIDLKTGMMNGHPEAHYGLSAAPVIYKNLVITGSHTQDAPSLGPRGDLRAWDVRTGKLIWTFHSIPEPGEPGHETWLDNGWKNRSGTNVWTTFSVDAATGAVFVTFDSPAADLWGGDRPGNNLYGNTLVAIDAATGKRKWFFQTIHHDIWDYDAPGPPMLTEVTRNGARIPVVALSNKTGFIFVLDRRDGKPVYEVREKPVPKGDVPGEWYSPTQPVPVKPPPITRQGMTRDEIAKVTPEQQQYCQALFDSNGGTQNEGAFTPMGVKQTVVFPASNGGANWGGASIDPALGYYFINTRSEGAIGRMGKPSELPPAKGKNAQNQDPNAYVRIGARGQNTGFANPMTGWPCQAPPWGELVAINLNTGDIAWREPFGRVDALEALGVMNTGSINIGGSVATAGGLLFIGASTDQRFHAFESKSGKLLWEVKLAANAQASPITYLGKDGRQYVAVVAGDTLLAYRLP